MFADPVIAFTRDLAKNEILNTYIKKGYSYIRQIHRPYAYITREPSIGCIVELSVKPDIGSVLIDSAKGRKLIRRISYFGYLYL